MALLFGIDAGTTTVSLVAYDTVKGKVSYRRSMPHEAYENGLPPGHREQVPDKILATLRSLLDDATLDNGFQPDSICVTGQMHGCLLIGAGAGPEKGTPLTRMVTWEDTRIRAEIDSFRSIYSQSRASGEGASAGPGYAAATLHWLSRRSRLPGRSYTVCSIQDWLVNELSGRTLSRISTDRSCAHSTGLYLPVSRNWDGELAVAVGITPDTLPGIVPTGEIVGKSAAIGGLKAGIPLCVGLGDNQASFLGSVSEPGSTALANVGTGSQISVWSREFRRIEGLDTRPYPGDSFIIVGAALCGGRAFSLLRDFVAEIGVTFFGVSSTADELYNTLITSARYHTDLIGDTAFSGTRTDPDRRGSITRLTADNFRIGDLTAAIIHGIGNELYELYKKTGFSASRLIGSGNGIRKNPLLEKELEDRFSLPLTTTPFDEEAALGAALAAGLGIGIFADIETVTHEVKRLES